LDAISFNFFLPFPWFASPFRVMTPLALGLSRHTWPSSRLLMQMRNHCVDCFNPSLMANFKFAVQQSCPEHTLRLPRDGFVAVDETT
jgi:hypothetical protein